MHPSDHTPGAISLRRGTILEYFEAGRISEAFGLDIAAVRRGGIIGSVVVHRRSAERRSEVGKEHVAAEAGQ